MNTFAEEMRSEVGQYVTNGMLMVNTLLLLCHIGFAVYLGVNHVDIAYYYNFISIIIYIAAFDMLRRKKTTQYIVMSVVEISVFVIIAVWCLGWDFGFQQYCIGLINAAFLIDFYVNKGRKVRSFTMAVVISEVVLYIVMRVGTYYNPFIYDLNDGVFAKIFFVVNTLVAFVIMIAFCWIYSNTVFQLEQTLLNVASVDPMTGLRNRRRMHELLDSVWKEYQKNPYPICIGMLDVDHFKKINDTYGHDVGDVVLKKLAETLLFKHEKQRDFHVCRWGGEEFLVLYKNCPAEKEEVYREFEGLRKEIEDTVVVNGNDRIRFTITIGLAFFSDEVSVTEMLKEADMNLYKGKESGRNKVIWK